VMQAGAGVRTVIEDELRRAGVRVRDLTVAMELGLQESAKSAVEAGHGVCFLSSLAVEKELRLGTLATAEVAGLDVREIPIRVDERRAPSINLLARIPNVLRSLARLTWAIRFSRPALARPGLAPTRGDGGR